MQFFVSDNNHCNRLDDHLSAGKELDIPYRRPRRLPCTSADRLSFAVSSLGGKPDIFAGNFENLFERRILAQKRSKRNRYRSPCILMFDLDKPI